MRAEDGRYLLQDAILAGSFWISAHALNDEGGGRKGSHLKGTVSEHVEGVLSASLRELT